ncbi:MAG: hypothetical protein ACI4DN_11735, partial [Lachnospiraceae bacterium]
MSKKVQAKTGKKKNYRLRKSVRRTLGALLMISAIIVAAIPFPDAAAADPGAGGSGGSAPGATTATISYAVTPANINKGVNLNADGITPDKIKSAYTLRKDDQNTWIYEEQFKYYLINSQDAIMYKYNNPYFVSDIVLSGRVNGGSYLTVEQNIFREFFEVDNPANYLTLTLADWGSVKAERFAVYYPELYKTYEAAYQTYLGDKTSQNEAAVTVTGKPTAIKTVDQQYKY